MKFVFIGPDHSSFRIQYADFSEKENMRLVLLNDRSRRLAKVFSISNMMKFSFSDYFFRGDYENIINKMGRKSIYEKMCFIIYGRILESYGIGIIRFLRKEYPDSKIVCYFGDLIKTHRINIEKIMRELDMVFTFDSREAEVYNIHWCLEPFSQAIFRDGCIKSGKKWDITFVGSAKNRYRKIISVYEKLKENGLKCDFHVVGVARGDRVYREEISYEPLEFTELLSHVANSSCVLEIMQEGAFSPSTRFAEASLFGKNLLTDCLYFKDAFHCCDNVFFMDDVSDLEKMDIGKLTEQHLYNEEYSNFFSVDRMAETIEKSLLENV